MIEESEWTSIHALVEDYFRKAGQSLTSGTVIKRDEMRRLVWVKEFGDEPISVVGNPTQLYIHRNSNRELLELPVVTPKIGDVILIAKVSTKVYCLGKIDVQRSVVTPPLIVASAGGGGAI